MNMGRDNRLDGDTQAGSPFSLQYFQPAPDLRDYIASYYLFSTPLPAVADVTRAEIAQLRFVLRGSGSYDLRGASGERSPAIGLLGATCNAVRFSATGGLRLFGAGLLPAGWAALVREDASLLADRSIDAEDLFGPLIGDIHDALANASSVSEMVSVANAGLRALLARHDHAPHWFTALADAWLVAGSAPRIDRLVAASGLSGRQVERLTARFYGCSPTLLARKYRTLRAAARLAAGQLDWRDVAADFYDQSHLIREFKRFTGVTPHILLNDPPPVTRLTLALRRENKLLPRLIAIS